MLWTLYPGVRATGTHWIRGLVGPRASLDAVAEMKFPITAPARNWTLVIQPEPSLYTHWATLAPLIKICKTIFTHKQIYNFYAVSDTKIFYYIHPRLLLVFHVYKSELVSSWKASITSIPHKLLRILHNPLSFPLPSHCISHNFELGGNEFIKSFTQWRVPLYVIKFFNLFLVE